MPNSLSARFPLSPLSPRFLDRFLHAAAMDINSTIDKLAANIDKVQPQIEQAVEKVLGKDAAAKAHDLIEKVEHALEDKVRTFSKMGREGTRRAGVRGRRGGARMRTRGWRKKTTPLAWVARCLWVRVVDGCSALTPTRWR